MAGLAVVLALCCQPLLPGGVPVLVAALAAPVVMIVDRFGERGERIR